MKEAASHSTVIQIERLGPENVQHWDGVYGRASNAQLMAHRSFFGYHADRFTDHSLLFRRGNRYLALLPANRDGDTLWSHQGVSFAGLVMARRARLNDVREIFESLREYLGARGFKKVVYRPAPLPYHSQPREDDLCWLQGNGARIIDTKYHAMGKCAPGPMGNQSYRHGVARARDHRIVIGPGEDLAEFWPHAERLLQAHGQRPVHSLDDLLLLKDRLPDCVILMTARKGRGEFLAGHLILRSPTALTSLYLGESPEGREIGAGILLHHHLATHPDHDGLWFDHGQWVDPDTRQPSESLLRFKESMGARTILRHTWEFDVCT